jgi:hypothetical protein
MTSCYFQLGKNESIEQLLHQFYVEKKASLLWSQEFVLYISVCVSKINICICKYTYIYVYVNMIYDKHTHTHMQQL